MTTQVDLKDTLSFPVTSATHLEPSDAAAAIWTTIYFELTPRDADVARYYRQQQEQAA